MRHLEALFAFFIGTMVRKGEGEERERVSVFLSFFFVVVFLTKSLSLKKIKQGASFAALAAVSGARPSEVARGLLVPSLPRGELATAVAIIGAVVMPHNLYLHSALVRAAPTAALDPDPSSPNASSSSPPPPGRRGREREEEEEGEAIPEEEMLRAASAAATGRLGDTPRGGDEGGRRVSAAETDATTAARAAAPRAEAVAYFALESAFALSVALAINVCLVVAVAAGLDKKERDGGGGGGGGLGFSTSFGFSTSSGSTPPPTPPPTPPTPPKTRTLGLADAGAFLSGKYGPAAAVVWGVGLLAAGQSSTM